MKICFLTNPQTPEVQAENAHYLSAAASELGHEVTQASIDALALRGDAVVSSDVDLQSFDLVWVLSLGHRDTFFDKMQLLELLASRTQVINSPTSLFYLHSKISLSDVADIVRHPETQVSCNSEMLWRIVQEQGGRWVVKPIAGSFGEGVFMLEKKEQLDAATTQGKHYCLMQRYIEEIKQGEKRVLIAGGKIVGQYLRRGTKDFRTNMHQGAHASECVLTREERQTCERVAQYLLERGVVFAGLDLCWPYLIEWNVVSPGGIATLHKLTGKNPATNVLQNVLCHLGFEAGQTERKGLYVLER